MTDDDGKQFRNFYRCTRCGNEWEMTWGGTIDEDCPKCGETMTPLRPEEVA